MANDNSNNPIVDMLANKSTVPEEVESVMEQSSSQGDGLVDEPAKQEELSTNEEDVQETVTEAPVEEPKASTTEEVSGEEQESTEEDSESSGNWYDDKDEAPASVEEIGEEKSVTPNESLKGISEALGIESFNDESLVLDEIKTIKSQRDDLQQRIETMENETPYANENLQKANELAKNGGDWQQFLGVASTDWTQVPDDALIVEAHIKPNLGGDEATVKAHLDGMSESDKKIKANEIRQELVRDQQQQMAEIQKQANERKKYVDEGLKKQLGDTKELFGVQVTAKDRQDIFKSLTSDNGFINDTFFNKDGSMNFKSMAEMAFMSKNISKIVKLNVQQAKTQGKKEVFDSATNTNLNKSNGAFNTPKATEKKSGLGEYYDQLRSGKSGW